MQMGWSIKWKRRMKEEKRRRETDSRVDNINAMFDQKNACVG